MKSRLLLLCLLPAAVCAQTAALSPSPIDTRLAAVEVAAKSAQSAGDNAWMLVSSALVLMMTGPGLALFYGGWSEGRTCSPR
jgi:Amt family ammonium transporter